MGRRFAERDEGRRPGLARPGAELARVPRRHGRTARALLYWEQSIAPLPDGRLLAVAWVFDEQAGTSLPNRYALSADDRFAPPRENGLRGQTAKILALRDGRVLCLYRREDRPGLWADLARIDGDAWVNLAEAPRLAGRRRPGMSGRAAAGEELGALKFGYPSMVQLPDGDVLAVFWCCEECIHNIRWIRLAIDG